MSPIRSSASRARTPFLFLLASLLMLLAALGPVGCGGGGEDAGDKDAVLATVDDAVITAAYYENRLAKLEEEELPRAEDGSLLDMAQMEGKLDFLNTLVNKEVMVLTASQMGFNRDPQVVGARNSLLSYEAGTMMWVRAIQEPANSITNEELDAFYARMGSSRKCRYVITNFREDAEAAREMAQAGADWEDVVAEYHDGDAAPSGVQEITVPFGRYTTEFEAGVFGVEIGDVTPVIPTVYGFWVLKVDSEKPGKKPALEEAKAQILDTTRNRKISKLKEDFRQEIYADYEFKINDDALWKCYVGLPANEQIFKPGTQEPMAQEDLDPLDIASVDLDLVFYSYVNPKEGPREYTLGDYKEIFDRMGVFQRPKKSEMLGGLRSKIENEMNKTLYNFKSEEMGLLEDPEVVDKVDIKIEEMIVHKLYNELVPEDEQVTLEELEAFWADHADEYYRAELRSGHLVLCRNEAKALEAKASLDEGMAWNEVLVKFGTDRENKSNAGRLENVQQQEGEPITAAMFALPVGGVSDPVALADGRFAVVSVEGIEEGRPIELEEVREAVGTRIKDRRREEAFSALLDDWRTKFAITINEENLAEVASWEELTAVEVPENLVPRN